VSNPVIVGTDLSPSAAEAIRQAGAWAARIGTRLVIVHVAPDELFAALETPKVVDALRERVDAWVRPLQLPYEVLLRAGSAHSALVREADQSAAELLVVGASGSGSVERAIFGSTAQQVVRYAHCPVLVTRASPADGPVLGATDFSVDAERAVEAAAREATRRHVPVRLVHSLYEPESSLSLLGPLLISAPSVPAAEREELRHVADETLRTLLEATGASGTSEALLGPPATAITEEARRIGAGLVVVATRGRTGLGRIALGSVAEAVVRQAPCSVLAVRRQPEQ